MRSSAWAVFITFMIIFMASAIVPSSAVFPTSFGNPYPQTVLSPTSGSVTGRVTYFNNGTIGLPNCYVAIVNTSNLSQEYAHTTTDEYGNFQFSGVTTTCYVPVGGPFEGPDGTPSSFDYGNIMYMIYVNDSTYGESYYGPFGVGYTFYSGEGYEEVGVGFEDVVIPGFSPIPMFLWGNISYSYNFNLNGSNLSNGKIIAFVYNASGYPVADGTVVDFAMGIFNKSSINGTMYGTYSEYDRVQTNGGKATINYTWFLPNQSSNAYIGVTATLNKTRTSTTQHTFRYIQKPILMRKVSMCYCLLRRL